MKCRSMEKWLSKDSDFLDRLEAALGEFPGIEVMFE